MGLQLFDNKYKSFMEAPYVHIFHTIAACKSNQFSYYYICGNFHIHKRNGQTYTDRIQFYIMQTKWLRNNSHQNSITIMAMEMDKIELMVELQVFTHIHEQRAVHRQFIPDTQ